VSNSETPSADSSVNSSTVNVKLEAELGGKRRSALSFGPFRIYFTGTVLAMNALRLGAVARVC